MPERRKNGPMNTAPASVTSASAFEPATLNRIRKTSAFFRKLSLKAEKNWHQNSGANRREVMSEWDTAGLSVRGRRETRRRKLKIVLSGRNRRPCGRARAGAGMSGVPEPGAANGEEAS